jgi:hypothetical protein
MNFVQALHINMAVSNRDQSSLEAFQLFCFPTLPVLARSFHSSVGSSLPLLLSPLTQLSSERVSLDSSLKVLKVFVPLIAQLLRIWVSVGTLILIVVEIPRISGTP